MDKRMEQKVDQVRALLAKTKEGANTTPEEAAAAAAKAAELMLKYNIDRQLVQATGKDDVVLVVGQRTIRLPWSDRWMKDLMWMIADNNFCKIVYHGSSHLVTLAGTEANIQVCDHLFVYLEREIRRLTNAAWKAVEKYPAQYGTRGGYRNSFRRGCIAILDRRLREMRKNVVEEDQTGSALIAVNDLQKAVDEFYAQTFGDLKDSKAAGANDVSGYVDGMKAGKEIALNAAVGAGKGKGKEAIVRGKATALLAG